MRVHLLRPRSTRRSILNLAILPRTVILRILQAELAYLRRSQKHRETVQRTIPRWIRCDVFYILMEVWIPSSCDDCRIDVACPRWLLLWQCGSGTVNPCACIRSLCRGLRGPWFTATASSAMLVKYMDESWVSLKRVKFCIILMPLLPYSRELPSRTSISLSLCHPGPSRGVWVISCVVEPKVENKSRYLLD